MAELTKDAKVIVRQGKALALLLASPSWPVYNDILQNQADHWGTKAVSPSTELFDLVKSEFAKGVLLGLRLAMTTPEATVAQMKDLMSSVSEADDKPADPEEDE